MKPTRLKILWLSHLVPYPPKGGVLQRSYNLLKAVSEVHDVSVLAFNQRALLPGETDVRRAVEAIEAFCRVVAVLDIPSERQPWGRLGLYLRGLLSPDGYTMEWLKSSAMAHAVHRELARRRIDLVHADTISLAAYAACATSAKRALNHHNIESQMVQRRADLEANPLRRCYLQAEARKLEAQEGAWCRLFDVNLTCSALDSERLRRHTAVGRIEVIPNGVDLDYFQASDGHGEPGRLVFAGGMSWYPNRDAMLWFADAIWPLVSRMVPEARITVIGRTPPERLRGLAARDARFEVTGFVDDVRPFLRNAEIYVCPVRDGGGTKLKLLDALAMGKPTVAHPVAVEGIEAEPGKHLLTASTAEEFAGQVARLRSDADLRRRLGAAGRRLIAERYDFKAIGARLSALYASVATACVR